MNEVPSTADRKTDHLPADFVQLAAAIQALPAEYRQTVEPLMARVAASNRRRQRILTLIQEALGQLRLDMKYLMFDLEATRRERDDYQRRLEQDAE